jgi:hypothetical protein
MAIGRPTKPLNVTPEGRRNKPFNYTTLIEEIRSRVGVAEVATLAM